MSVSFDPGWSSPPGDTIVDLMDERDLPHGVLAQALDLDADEFSRLLTGTLEITSELALKLATYLGSTPQFWSTRETQYRNRT